ncbi:MAG: NAD(+)/NADH kinase, partial [Oscillospiraceae bacterium]|nr:NAD(+)/NADH kinase [Oscillospiraceae bacterium]
MKAIVTANLEKPNGAKLREEVIDRLKAVGIEILGEISPQALADCDFVVAVGGDGTIIGAAKAAAVYRKPVLGVNNGRVGFLAGVEPERLERLILLVSGEYRVEERALLRPRLAAADGAVLLT